MTHVYRRGASALLATLIAVTMLLTGAAAAAAETETATITGTVTDADTEEPIEDIFVFLLTEDGETRFGDVKTDGEGHYLIEVPAGESYMLWFDEGDPERAGGYKIEMHEGLDVAVDDTVEFDQAMTLGISISGTAIFPEGLDGSSATVGLEAPSGRGVEREVRPEAPEFRVQGMPSGVYAFSGGFDPDEVQHRVYHPGVGSIALATPIEADPGTDLAGLELTFGPDGRLALTEDVPAGRIEGRVVDARTSTPLPGIRAVLTDCPEPGEQGLGDNCGLFGPGWSMVTASDGTFSLEVAPGQEYGLFLEDLEAMEAPSERTTAVVYGFWSQFGLAVSEPDQVLDLGDVKLEPHTWSDPASEEFIPPATPPRPGGEAQVATSQEDEAPRAGGSITISGEGFDPGESVPVYVYSEPVLLGRTTADDQGRIEFTADLPESLTPGTHTVVAYGRANVLAAEIEVSASDGSLDQVVDAVEETEEVDPSTSDGRSDDAAAGEIERLPETGTALAVLVLAALALAGGGTFLVRRSS